MFWKLSFLQPCAIDALLDKEDCTLDEILDEDDVLQELKVNNTKLTNFLAQPAMLERLVDMVCIEPGEDVEDKVKFKYPHLACEILKTGIPSIVAQLESTPSLMDTLWAFLDSTEPLNPLLASFTSKVIGMLLKNPESKVVEYVQSKENFLDKLLYHLGTSAVMDLLLKLVGTSPDHGYGNLSMWLVEDQGVINRLVDFIKNDSDPEQCVNASMTLCEMIRQSRMWQDSNAHPLRSLLEGKDLIERLLNNIFVSEKPSNTLVISGVSVLLMVLRDDIFPDMEPEPSTLDSAVDSVPSVNKCPPNAPPGIDNTLEIIVPWLKKFHTLLKQAPEISRMNTTVGVLEPPLGNVRLQIIKLISALLSKVTSAIAAEVVVLDMFSTLIDLFFAYPWNNFLHMHVELCVCSVLNSSQPQDAGVTGDMSRGRENLTVEEREREMTSKLDEESLAARKSLTTYLLKDCQFVCKLLDGVIRNDELAKGHPWSRRQGYMGHVIRLANTLVKFGEVSELLTHSMDDPTRQRWNNFVNGPLADMNKRNETDLGGANQPVSLNMDDSDEDFEQTAQDSELEKAYQQYLDLKYSANYREDYGMDELSATEEPFEASFTRLMDITRVISADEEQPQASTSLFEAACSDRIQQFDDEEESEEEEEGEDDVMWPDKDANLASPMDHHSISSDDDEEFISNREFPTGESYESVSSMRSPPKKPPHPRTQGGVITQISSTSSDPDKMEIESPFSSGMWRDISNKGGGAASEDVPMENADWTKEPDGPKSMSDDQNQDTGWADFSKFPATFGASSVTSADAGDNQSEERFGVTTSHITVTYRDSSNQQEEDDDDFLEPLKRPDTSKYHPLNLGQKEGSEEDRAMSYETGNLSYNSDDDDLNTSSDSDEEKTGSYNMNTTQGSEGEQLINSLNDSREQEVAILSPSHQGPSSSTSSSANGGVADDATATSQLNRHDSNEMANVNDSSSEKPMEGDENELDDNFKFLSKGMLSHSGSEASTSEDSIADGPTVEQKRAEAHEACSVYTNEVSGTSSIET